MGGGNANGRGIRARGTRIAHRLAMGSTRVLARHFRIKSLTGLGRGGPAVAVLGERRRRRSRGRGAGAGAGDGGDGECGGGRF